MRRIVGLLLLLLVLDQFAKNLINQAVSAETLLLFGDRAGMAIGNYRHYVPFEKVIGILVRCFSISLMLFVYGWAFNTGKVSTLVPKLFFSAGCFLFEGITQGIDFILHGYVIDYVGFYIKTPIAYGVLAHVGDYLYGFGVVWGFVGFLSFAKEKVFRMVPVLSARSA